MPYPYSTSSAEGAWLLQTDPLLERLVFFVLRIKRRHTGLLLSTSAPVTLVNQWRRSHEMDFWRVCSATKIINLDQKGRINKRGWAIFLSANKTSADLGTIKHGYSGFSGDFRRRDAGRITYITVISVPLSFDVGHLLAPTSTSAELISMCGKAASSQHSRLLQRVPQAASSSPARGSGWLPGGAACGTSVLACGAQIRQICSLSLPPL